MENKLRQSWKIQIYVLTFNIKRWVSRFRILSCNRSLVNLEEMSWIRLTSFHMTSELCLYVFWGHGGGGWGWLRWAPHPLNEAHSQSFLFTDRPASCTFLTVQLHSRPDPSVWCERRVGGEGGSPPLMFSLGTACSLFNFQSKQRQHLQFEQIVQCCPAGQRAEAEGRRTGRWSVRSAYWTKYKSTAHLNSRFVSKADRKIFLDWI